MLCNQKGVSTNDVAKATGIPQTTLANWKKRRNILNAKAAQKIADYFGVSLQYLMTGENPPARIESNLNDLSQLLRYDYLVGDNDDLKYIIEAMSKWQPKHIAKIRKKVEELNEYIGGEE